MLEQSSAGLFKSLAYLPSAAGEGHESAPSGGCMCIGSSPGIGRDLSSGLPEKDKHVSSISKKRKKR